MISSGGRLFDRRLLYAFVMLGHAGNKIMKPNSSTIVFYCLQKSFFGGNRHKQARTWYRTNNWLTSSPYFMAKHMQNHVCVLFPQITPFLLTVIEQDLMLSLCALTELLEARDQSTFHKAEENRLNRNDHLLNTE